MKYEIVPNSCRICLQKSRKFRSIYTPTEDGEEPPNEMLKQITGIDLVEDNYRKLTLPKNICKNCELSLNMAFQFRIKALKSQRIIELYCLQQLRTANAELVQDKFMFEVKEEYVEVNEDLEQITVDTEELDCQRLIKVEKLESPYAYEMQNYEGNEDKVEYLDELFLDIEDAEEQYQTDSNEVVATSSANVTHISESPTEQCNPKRGNANVNLHPDNPEGNVLEPKACSKKLKQLGINSFTNRAKRKSKRNVSSTGLRLRNKRERNLKSAHESYICDICGNIYAKRGRMMEHRRRHNNDFSYACELCDKRFNFRELLRKHMYMHSGGKPYKCSFCSRTFFYESVKRAHEAVHSGYKPYVCEECNKPFAYSHALKKHKLIHADIKLYHCEYCNKDFRLQHHMKQHEETKTHQNAVRAAEGNKFKNSDV